MTYPILWQTYSSGDWWRGWLIWYERCWGWSWRIGRDAVDVVDWRDLRVVVHEDGILWWVGHGVVRHCEGVWMQYGSMADLRFEDCFSLIEFNSSQVEEHIRSGKFALDATRLGYSWPVY